MPSSIDRDAVHKLLPEAQVVEVLGSEAFAQFHLPGALNIPLAELDRRAPGELRRDEPVVVYCHDSA
jgi:rhodanese-related sulfurtransferase